MTWRWRASFADGSSATTAKPRDHLLRISPGSSADVEHPRRFGQMSRETVEHVRDVKHLGLAHVRLPVAVVVRLIARFFSTPSAGPRALSELVSQLASPPIGLPLGVIPILVMAGYRAFAKIVSLRSEGAYVRDILGFEASKMFVEPRAPHDRGLRRVRKDYLLD